MTPKAQTQNIETPHNRPSLRNGKGIVSFTV